MTDFNSPEYKRSRIAYIIQCTVYYFVTILVTDAFLAKLLEYVGISDGVIGIISSFVSLAFIFQAFSIVLVKIKIGVKRTVMLFDTAGIFFFMLLYLVPFFPVSKAAKTAIIIICVIVGYAANYLIQTICYQWANSYVDPKKRASYSAGKEMISLASGLLFTMICGAVIDKFEGIGNPKGGFLFIAISVLILNISNFICYALIKKEDETISRVGTHSLKDVFAHTLGNKDFRRVTVLTVLWSVAQYFTVGFMGVFKTKDLALSMTLIQGINIIANLARLAISRPLGRYSDGHTFAKGFKLGLYLAAGAFFMNLFTTKNMWFFVILYSVLYACALAGINQNSFNIIYSYVETDYVTQAMAIKNCIGGIFGFAASVAGGKILNAVQANGNRIFGFRVYGQQILSLISLIITGIAIIYTKRKIEKQKVTVR